MQHYLLELAVWILVAFFLGCLIGWLLRRAFGARPASRAEIREQPEVPVAPAPEVAAVAAVELQPEAPAATPEEPAPAIEPIPSMRRMERPKGLPEARGGIADNLQRISGVGPKNEKILHNLGVFHFDQIAVWTADHVAWVDDHLKFNGRITRERWIVQAGLLAEGKEEEFNAQFGAKVKRP